MPAGGTRGVCFDAGARQTAGPGPFPVLCAGEEALCVPPWHGGSLRGLLSLRWGQPGAETCKRRSRRPSGQLPPREGPARSSRGVVVHTAGSCRRVNPSSAPGRVSGCCVCLHFSLVWGEIKQVSAGGPGTRARTNGPTLPALVPLPRPRAGTSAPPCPARCGRFQNRTLTSEKLELLFF